MASASRVFVARHGERIDHIDLTWVSSARNPHDPFLTPVGLRQARALGTHLADKNLTHIFSSPFYRTVQTANEVADLCNLPIKIEPGIGEFLNPLWFPESPRLKGVAELADEFTRVDKGYEAVCTPEYPETRVALIERAGRTARLLAGKYGGNILLVGHGITCEFTVRGITGAGTIPYISYCALQVCKREDDEQEKYVVDGAIDPDISFMPEDIRPSVKTGYR